MSVHFKEFFREPGIIFWAILFPLLLAFGLGMAFSGQGQQERTIAVVSPRENTNIYTDLFAGSKNFWSKKLGNEKLGYTVYNFQRSSWDNAIQMLKQGKVNLIIRVNPDSIKYHFDPSNPEAKLAYLQLTSELSGSGQNINDDQQIAVLRQEGTRYIDFLVPGLMAMSIMMNCMWGISYSNVDKRNKKLLRRMVATPMRKSYYVIAQFIARLSLSALEALLLFLFTAWIFNITITGSIPGLVVMFLTGNMAFMGLAMLISSRTSNTQIANGLINLVILPMMILSGIYFSYHNFPDFMIGFIKILPLTMLADEIRRVFLEGTRLVAVLPKAGILAGLGLISFIAGIKVYKWY